VERCPGWVQQLVMGGEKSRRDGKEESTERRAEVRAPFGAHFRSREIRLNR